MSEIVTIQGPWFEALTHVLRRCCKSECIAPEKCRHWWDVKVCHNTTKDMTQSQFEARMSEFRRLREALKCSE